jgi:hypothetical protein
MRDSYIDLKRINWQHGMLLCPDHFLQQERYFESYIRWHAKYCLSATGLLGNGVRNPPEDALLALDPVVTVQQDDQTLKIIVSQLRAIAESGQIFEVDEESPAVGEFLLQDIAGQQQLDVYVVTDPTQVTFFG